MNSRISDAYQQGYQNGLRASRNKVTIGNRLRRFLSKPVLSEEAKGVLKNRLTTFGSKLRQGVNQGKERFNTYRQNRQNKSNNRRKFANMNYNTQNMKYVPKGTATRAVVGGFKPNVFAKKTKGFFEKLNPFPGTRFFGPSNPGYVNSSGIAITSNYRDRQIIADKKANNSAQLLKKQANYAAAARKQANNTSRRLSDARMQNRVAKAESSGLYSQLFKAIDKVSPAAPVNPETPVAAPRRNQAAAVNQTNLNKLNEKLQTNPTSNNTSSKNQLLSTLVPNGLKLATRLRNRNANLRKTSNKEARETNQYQKHEKQTNARYDF